MATPFDALFQAPPAKVEKTKLGRAAPHIQVVKGVCQRCKKYGVFWSLPPGPYCLCELEDGQAIRHTCTPVDDSGMPK